ncbi:MAG: S41 family peptidase [Myxococcales bacterium]|nr:S41 family peptidase [Myxococcales bacterium]
MFQPRPNAFRSVLPLLLLAAACTGPAGPRETFHLPAAVTTARRVVEVFERRHVDGGRLDDARSRWMFEHLLSRLDPGREPTRACGHVRAELVHWAERLDDALWEGDLGFPELAAQRCTGRVIGRTQARSLLFDALAKSFDPHSAFLPPGPLAAVDEPTFARAQVVERAGARIGHLVVPSLYLRFDGRSTSGDLVHLVQGLKQRKAQVLLLDLRGNGGGVMSEVPKMAAMLTGPVAAGYVLEREPPPITLVEPRQHQVWHGPLVVAVDGWTASGAELLASALQDHGRALVAGERTQGKGTVQSLVWLSSPLGTRVPAVRVTSARMFRPSGTGLQRTGVVPDIPLALSAQVERERDRPGALPARDLQVTGVVAPLMLPARLRAELTAAAAGRDGTEALLRLSALWSTVQR